MTDRVKTSLGKISAGLVIIITIVTLMERRKYNQGKIVIMRN